MIEGIFAKAPADEVATRDVLDWARFLLAAVEMLEGRAEGALAILDGLERKYDGLGIPIDLMWRMLQADCHCPLGRLDEAERLWRSLIDDPALPPNLAEYFDRWGMRSRLGAVSMQRGDYPAAEPWITEGYLRMKDREGPPPPASGPGWRRTPGGSWISTSTGAGRAWRPSGGRAPGRPIPGTDRRPPPALALRCAAGTPGRTRAGPPAHRRISTPRAGLRAA